MSIYPIDSSQDLKIAPSIECWLFRSYYHFNRELLNLNAANVRKLIAAGIDPNQIDAKGCTPLTRLISQAISLESYKDRTPYTETIRALIEGGADINKRDKLGRTPLSIAVTCDQNLPIVQILLQHHVRTDLRTLNRKKPGLTPLQTACMFTNNPDIVNLLLKQGLLASGTGTLYGHESPLMIAASYSNKLEIVKAILASETFEYASPSGKICHRKFLLDMQDEKGETALHKAVRDARSLEIVRALIKAGADKNLTDKSGKRAADLTTDPEMLALLNA